MPWEFGLMMEGRRSLQDLRRRETAHYLSLLLTAHCGKPITAAQVLGEEERSDEDQGARRIAEIQRKIKRRLRKKA